MSKNPPKISREELIELARRQTIVRWFPSGKIELLRFATGNPRRTALCAPAGLTRNILAVHCLTGKTHPLNLKREEYWLTPIEPETLITFGDLMR